jgi:hypothetical protein
MPIIFGGSKKHICTQKDFVGDSLFEDRVREGNHRSEYEFDWSFIGSITSPDRRSAVEILESVERENVSNSHMVISRPNFKSAESAAVPYDKYMQIVTRSKINISLNGYGLWCTRDGELFAIRSFCLRQSHPCLSVNALTPKNDKHWVVFANDDLRDKLYYFIRNDNERESIRRCGFDYFKGLLEGDCAKHYAGRIVHFFNTGAVAQFAGIALGD